MMADDTPHIFFVCGCDGVGKSTLIGQVLGATTLPAFPIVSTKGIASGQDFPCISAGRNVILEDRMLVGRRASFIHESRLTSRYDFHLAQMAKMAGFRAELVYIGVASESIALKRVHGKGESGRETDKAALVHRHYERSIGNIPKAVQIFDRVTLLDNTSPEFKLFARFECGNLELYSFCPAWFRGIHKAQGFQFTGIYD